MRHGWSLAMRLIERRERRIDDARMEAMHERTRASVASMTARVLVETAIELPRSAERVWSVLFESGDGSPLREPGVHGVSLQGPGEDEVGFRETGLTDSWSVGLVWRTAERERGVVLRSECESTPGTWVAYRFEPLAADRCRLTLAKEFGATEGTRDAWAQACKESHHVLLGKTFTALTGSEPPTPFREALAFAEAFPGGWRFHPTVSDQPLVELGVTASVDVRATAPQVWELVRDLERVGLPDMQDDGRYAPAGPGGSPDDETWVGLRPSALGTPVAVAVLMSDEVPGRRFVARAIGGRGATTTVEVIPTTGGCTVTVQRDSVCYQKDVEIVRRGWQRAVSRYVSRVALAAVPLG